MPYNFQFTFFGCQHNYLARVTMISNEGVPQDDSLTETYGLPPAFAAKMTNKAHKRRFFYNVRGHDFLSHSGQWKGKGRDDVGHVETAYVPISESSLLESLCRENEEKKFLGPNMIISLGPRAGSVFVKAYSLKRYEWDNLPADLNREIQKINSVRGYDRGVIEDLAMNASGGWVILLDKGKSFTFGGELPFDLRMTLQNAQEAKRQMPKLDISIYRIYLNHQHAEEYVLIFGDGQCFIRLHSKFRDPMERLLTKWATGKSKFHLTFTPSCDCSEYCQKMLNASYYSRRGLFFLARKKEKMALQYLREASHQDGKNLQIRDSYCITITAMRQARPRDQTLEDMIQNRPTRVRAHRPPLRRPENYDEDTFFRDEYMWMLDEQDIGVKELERKLDELQRPFLNDRWKLGAGGATSDWSYDMAVAGDKPHELAVAELCERIEGSNVFEVEAEVLVNRAETHVSELSSSVDEIEGVKADEAVPQRRIIDLNAPIWEKPKSRNLFSRLKKWKE